MRKVVIENDDHRETEMKIITVVILALFLPLESGRNPNRAIWGLRLQAATQTWFHG